MKKKMNGILKKNNEIYSLLVNGVEFAFYDKNRTERPLNSLSIKNCKAIENGYDLMKLAEENSHKYYDVKTTDWHCNYNGFFSGFQKALEILHDKKFTKEDMGNLWDFCAYNKGTFKEGIQSLQQTEWEVEIKQVNQLNLDSGKFEWKPILDADGCLILKRKV